MLLYPSPSPFGIFCFQGKRIRILPHLTEKGYRISHRISRKTKCYNSGMANMGLLWGTREQEKWTSKAVPLGWNSLNYFPFLTLFAQGSNSHERTGLVWTMHPACWSKDEVLWQCSETVPNCEEEVWRRYWGALGIRKDIEAAGT